MAVVVMKGERGEGKKGGREGWDGSGDGVHYWSTHGFHGRD